MTVDSPFTVTGEAKVPVSHAPHLGQHSSEILREAGYSQTEIAELRTAGAIAGE